MPDGYAFVLGECYGCGRTLTFNPVKVPSTRDERGIRQPLCRSCVEYVNRERQKIGQPPFTIPPDAYEPVREEELPPPLNSSQEDPVDIEHLRELMDKVTIHELTKIVSHLTFEVSDGYPSYWRDRDKQYNIDYFLRWVSRYPDAEATKLLIEHLESKVAEKEAYPVRGPVPGTRYLKWEDFTRLPSYPLIQRAVHYPHDYRRKCSPVTKDGYLSVDAVYNISAWESWKSSSLDPTERRIAEEINKLNLYELMRLNKGRRADQPALLPEALLR